MARYRKKPVVIEAWHFTGQDRMDWPEPFAGDKRITANLAVGGKPVVSFLTIHTPEGNMYAQPGDWIIRGVKNEVYPCNPDIFDATYEPA